MMAITTSSSISVNPRRGVVFESVGMAVTLLVGLSGIRYRFGSSPSFDTSQTLTVWSRLPETSRRPSGLNATLETRPVWPRKLRTSSPLRLSQIFTVLSSPPEAIHRPVGAERHGVNVPAVSREGLQLAGRSARPRS